MWIVEMGAAIGTCTAQSRFVKASSIVASRLRKTTRQSSLRLAAGNPLESTLARSRLHSPTDPHRHAA